MNDDGSFADQVTNTAGMWVRCDDVQLVQFVRPEVADDDSAGPGGHTGAGTGR
jgi:hypothetical protein